MAALERSVLNRVVVGENLNNFPVDEQEYFRAVVSEMLTFALNVLLLREGVAHTGVRDDTVLGRKIPDEFWALLWDGCTEAGFPVQAFLSERGRASVWIFLNSRPDLLSGLANYVLSRLGVSPRKFDPTVITDGNFLYNLGGVLPARFVVALCYCLAFWGRSPQEPWVRLFSGRAFILFLVFSGALVPRNSLPAATVTGGYCGLVDVILKDMRATRGRGTGAEALTYHSSLTYLFVFNNATHPFVLLRDGTEVTDGAMIEEEGNDNK